MTVFCRQDDVAAVFFWFSLIIDREKEVHFGVEKFHKRNPDEIVTKMTGISSALRFPSALNRLDEGLMK